MEKLSEKELNEYIYDSYGKYITKIKMMQNSKTINEYKTKGNKFELLEYENQVYNLNEYINKIQRGELIANIPADEEIEGFESVDIKIPELGDVTVYEPKSLVEKTKKDAYKETEKRTSENEENSKLSEYNIVTLKDKDGNSFDLITDKNGNDIGTITYDKKGKPEFNIAPELKDKIDNLLEKSEVRKYVEEQILQEEFYLKNVDSLVRAIEEGKLVPDSVEEVGNRAISAKKIKENDYTDLDADRAVILTPEEIEEKNAEEAELERKIEDDELRKNEEEIEEDTKLQEKTDTDGIKPTNNDQPDYDDENNNKNIQETKQKEVEEYCKQKGISTDNVEAVLIVKDPKPLFDAMDNSNINENGGEVTIIQFSTATGKSKVAMIQDEAELKVDNSEEIANNFINKYHMRTGVIKRTEDNDTYIDYTDSQGNSYKMQLKRIPEDMSMTEKEKFRERLEIHLKELNMVLKNNPENTELINKLQEKIYKEFDDVGLTPPGGGEKKEPNENEEELEDDGYDPRDHRGSKY